MKTNLLFAVTLLTLSSIPAYADEAAPPAAAVEGVPGVSTGSLSNVAEGGAPGSEGSAAEKEITQPEPVANTCNYQDLVGKHVDGIDHSRFTGHVVRTLKPGQMVTMEYLEGRINLQVDDNRVIVAVTCG